MLGWVISSPCLPQLVHSGWHNSAAGQEAQSKHVYSPASDLVKNDQSFCWCCQWLSAFCGQLKLNPPQRAPRCPPPQVLTLINSTGYHKTPQFIRILTKSWPLTNSLTCPEKNNGNECSITIVGCLSWNISNSESTITWQILAYLSINANPHLQCRSPK